MVRVALGCLFAILVVSSLCAGQSFEYCSTGFTHIGFFNNTTGVPVDGLIIRCTKPLESMYAVGVGADMRLVSSSESEVVYHGAVAPGGTWEVDWEGDGFHLDSATWMLGEEAVEEIDVHAPTARLHLRPGLHPLEVVLSARGSIDPDGLPLVRFVWQFTDGVTLEGQDVARTFPRAGRHTVWLTVFDAEGKASQCYGIARVESQTQGAATNAIRVLYVYSDEGASPSVMTSKLEAYGYEAEVRGDVPADLGRYVAVVVSGSIGSAAAQRLEEFALGGGGVLLMGSSPRLLDMDYVPEWVGATSATSVVSETRARVVGDEPFGTVLSSLDEVATAVNGTSLPAMTGLALDSTPVALWSTPGVLSFAHAHPYGLGRVYYQAAVENAVEESESWDLLLSGLAWSTRRVDSVYDLRLFSEDWESGSIDPDSWQVLRSIPNAECALRTGLAHSGDYALFMSDHVGYDASSIVSTQDFASPYAVARFWEYVDEFTDDPPGRIYPRGWVHKHFLGEPLSEWTDSWASGNGDVGFIDTCAIYAPSWGESLIRWTDGDGGLDDGVTLPKTAQWDIWQQYTVKVLSNFNKVLVYHEDDLIYSGDTPADGTFRAFGIRTRSWWEAGPDAYLDDIEIQY